MKTLAVTRRPAPRFSLFSPITLMACSAWLFFYAMFRRPLLAIAIAVPYAIGFSAFQAAYKSRGGRTELSMRQFAIFCSVVCAIGALIAFLIPR